MFLLQLAVAIVFGVIGAALHLHWLRPLVYDVTELADVLPSIAVGVRRLHDLDKSAWWYLLLLLPLIGAVVLLVWFCMPGTAGRNRFGADPLSGF